MAFPLPGSNKRSEIGVPRDAASSTHEFPTVTDIGVPTEGLVSNPPAGIANGPTNTRRDTLPVARTFAQQGIGVPFNPNDGTTRT